MAPSLLSGQVDIIEIHQNNFDTSLAKDIYAGLDTPNGEKRTLPTLILYDSEGLRLFEEITYLDEYYLTNAEIDVLTTHAKRIVEQIPENSQLVELGSGSVSSHSSSAAGVAIISFIISLFCYRVLTFSLGIFAKLRYY